MFRPCALPHLALPSANHPRAEDAPMGPSVAGPGWYESTWDLASGLEVTEVLGAEAQGRRGAAAVESLSARA